MIFRRARCLGASARTLILAIALAPILGINANADAQDVETVALSGDQAPGADPGVVFSGFGVPVLNAKGQTAFRGILTGTGVNATNDKGIYSEGSGTLIQVAREGDQAPDAGGGVVFSELGDPHGKPLLNAKGQTAFAGLLTGTGVTANNDKGVYSEGSGTLAQLVREGDQTPGAAPGVVFFEFSKLSLNAAGQTAFYGYLTGTDVVRRTNDRGIYSNRGGTLAQVARRGDQAPDAEDCVVFSGLSLRVLNTAGQTAFKSSLTGPGVDLTNDFGIYSEGSGALAQVAREGDQAPGAGAGVVFGGFRDLAFNAVGQAVFSSPLTGPSVELTKNLRVYRAGSGGLTQVARKGDQAPGAGDGVVFDFFISPVLNARGQTAFKGALTGPGVDSTNFTNDFGIYSEGNGTLTQVAREGDQAPDAGDGVVFYIFSDPLLNAAGQTAFAVCLRGTGVDSTNNNGIYATDLQGQLIEIIRTGDRFDVDDDPLLEDFRTVETISFSYSIYGNERNGYAFAGDARHSGFNDLGQIAFSATFTDGSSGTFVSNLVSVAQPPSP